MRSGPFQDDKGRWRGPNGRFIKVAGVLAEAASNEHGGGKRGSLTTVASKVSASRQRDDAVERMFSDAAKATKAQPAAPKTGRPRKRRLEAGATPDAQQTIRDSVARHANASGWASIADIRDDLDAAGITNRAEQDATLKSMLKHPDVRIVPIADTKNLNARDKEAALFFANTSHHGDAGHAIQIGGDSHAAAQDAFVPPTANEIRAEISALERDVRIGKDAGFPEESLAGQRKEIDRLRGKLAGLDTSAAGTAKPAKRKSPRGALANAGAKQQGEPDFQSGLRAIQAEEAASGSAEIRRLGVQIDTEQRTVNTRRNELIRINAKIADLEANGETGSPRYADLLDAREAAQEEIDDTQARIDPLQRRQSDLELGLVKPSKPKGTPRGSLSTAGAKLAKSKRH